MSDFGIKSSSNKVNNKKNNKDNGIFQIIIIIVISLLIGFTVYFLSSKVLGNNKNNSNNSSNNSSSISIDDNLVDELYSYVSRKSNLKFIREPNLLVDNFTNKEKYYYALQFVEAKDLEVDSKEDNSYILSSDKVKEYMTKFFGSGVTYSKNITMDYDFDFYVSTYNIANVSYNQNKNNYSVVFSGNSLDNGVNYHKELVKASKGADGSIILIENVLFTSVSDNGLVNIYKDYDKTMLIASVDYDSFDADKYLDKGSTITYTFKNDNGNYYFYSSKISY